MEEIKYKITTQFKILESSESDSTKIVARSKDSEVQKHRSYIDQLLDTTQGMKYEVQEMMIDSSVEDEMVHKWDYKWEDGKLSRVCWSIKRISRRSMWQGWDK